jgi:crotonobetainyl-CoA:carnitine CoA-transferase CaiB-like acyl-CoA transferase
MNHENSYQDTIQQLFDVENLSEKPEALKVVRVLEVCALVLGPSACDYLAEFGAEVIKFEGQRGDQMRFVTPYDYFWKDMSLGLETQNHNKYWVGMHLGNPRAKELFLEFVEKSDVVVDNLMPGRMAEWGLSYKELKEINPRLIQLHVSGYGSWGPWAGRTSYDAIAQSMGGLAAITGFEDRGPIKSGVWIADWITGLMAAVSILTALNYRQRTGEGQFIDYLQVENVIRWLDWTWLYTYRTGQDRPRSGNRDLAICPSELFDCADGWVALAAFGEEAFCGLCTAMNRPDLYEQYAEPLERLKDKNARELLEAISEWAHTKTVEEVIALADTLGFAASRVLEAKDAYHTRHYRERGAIQEYEDALYGHMVQHCYPPRLSETPSRLRWSCRPLGFDNAHVFTKLLDLPLEQIDALEREGVIFRWDPDVPSQGPPPGWDGMRGMREPKAGTGQDNG